MVIEYSLVIVIKGEYRNFYLSQGHVFMLIYV